MSPKVIFSAATLATLAVPAFADASITLGLSLSGDLERKLVAYDCGAETRLAVEYLNAAPDFLALIPIDGAPRIFVNTISASGAKYESGPYVWWNKGNDATLSDITEGLDAAPVLTCSEIVETP